MFDNLSERLERSFKLLKGEGKITEINDAETLKDVRRALLDADVNYKVAKSFTYRVKENVRLTESYRGVRESAEVPDSIREESLYFRLAKRSTLLHRYSIRRMI